MIDESRKHIYDYLYDLFYDTITKNVYEMYEPTELTKSDVKDGFIVTHVGTPYDVSEFTGETYGLVRCYVEAYIPPVSRGRVDCDKYEAFENGIEEIVKMAMKGELEISDTYYIQDDSILSSDTDSANIEDNLFFTFIKSFIVVINSSHE